MNRIQPLAAHVAYMTCPGNHGALSSVCLVSTCLLHRVLLQRSLISSATILTDSRCLLVITHSGIHLTWALYTLSGNYNYNHKYNL